MTDNTEPIHIDQECVNEGLPPRQPMTIRKLNESIHDHGFNPPLQVGERWKARREKAGEQLSAERETKETP